MVKNTLSKLIDAHQEKSVSEARNYIGASAIGSDCLRQIWYELKGFEGIGVSPKTRRTWAIGKNLEKLIMEWLAESGLSVADTWYDLVDPELEFFKGHIDAMLLMEGKPNAILEIKTAKDASFKIFASKGLFIWNERYYAQIQSYMGMSGIHTAYILVLNKDNSDIADECVTFDAHYYELLKQKALMIYKAQVEPPRINGSPLWYQCKLCQFNKVCHK